MNLVPKNYRTALCGLAIAFLAVALKQGWLDQESVMAAGMVATALGFGFARDAKVSSEDMGLDKPKDPQP